MTCLSLVALNIFSSCQCEKIIGLTQEFFLTQSRQVAKTQSEILFFAEVKQISRSEEVLRHNVWLE